MQTFLVSSTTSGSPDHHGSEQQRGSNSTLYAVSAVGSLSPKDSMVKVYLKHKAVPAGRGARGGSAYIHEMKYNCFFLSFASTSRSPPPSQCYSQGNPSSGSQILPKLTAVPMFHLHLLLWGEIRRQKLELSYSCPASICKRLEGSRACKCTRLFSQFIKTPNHCPARCC